MKIKKPKPDSKILKILILIKNIFFAVILTLFAAILVVTMISRVSGKAPSLMGYSVYRISSGSMEPTLKVGEVILSKSCDPESIAVGDIVTYEGQRGEFKDKIVTHRVERGPYSQSGERYIVTKGDNNPASDSPVNVNDILGKMECKLGAVSALYDFFVTPWGLISIILLIVLAFFNEIIIFVKSLLGFKEDDENSLESIIERYKNEQLAEQEAEEKAQEAEAVEEEPQEAEAAEEEPQDSEAES